MAAGVPVDGQITLPCEVSQIDNTHFKIVLKQGLNRQIRKMAKYCGYKVIDLYRVRIANYVLNPNEVSENTYQAITLDALL
jgi:16S rRNA pseudouridine516 synthase